MRAQDKAIADIAAIERACAVRNKRELYRLMACSLRELFPDRPVDIEKVKVMARCYAGEIHGWEIKS